MRVACLILFLALPGAAVATGIDAHVGEGDATPSCSETFEGSEGAYHGGDPTGSGWETYRYGEFDRRCASGERPFGASATSEEGTLAAAEVGSWSSEHETGHDERWARDYETCEGGVPCERERTSTWGHSTYESQSREGARAEAVGHEARLDTARCAGSGERSWGGTETEENGTITGWSSTYEHGVERCEKGAWLVVDGGENGVLLASCESERETWWWRQDGHESDATIASDDCAESEPAPAAPSLGAADAHAGTDETSRACAGPAETYDDGTYASRYRDQDCTSDQDALAASAAVDGEDLAGARVGEHRDTHEEEYAYTSPDSHSAWRDSRGTSTEGARAHLMDEEARLDWGRCAEGDGGHAWSYASSEGWWTSRECERGAYASAAGVEQDVELYDCDTEESEWRDEQTNSTWYRRDCSVLVDREVTVDGDGYHVYAGYVEWRWHECYGEAAGTSCWTYEEQGVLVEVNEVRDGQEWWGPTRLLIEAPCWHPILP